MQFRRLATLRAILALGLLVGLLGMQSMMVSHFRGAAEHQPSAVSAGSAMPAMAAAGSPVSGGAAPATTTAFSSSEIVACSGDLAAPCTAMGVACLLVLAVLSMLFAAALPAVFSRLVPPSVRALRVRPSSATWLPPPSLIALCVSRT